MSRMFRLFLAVSAIAAVIASASSALAAGQGTISGRVVNKTVNGAKVDSVELNLVEYSNGIPTDVRRQATTDAEGRFEFKDLPVASGVSYAVGATFQSANYTSSLVTLTSDNASQIVELIVFDSTTSDEAIHVSNGHLVVFANQGALEVMEVWRLSNAGDKTFVGGSGTTESPTLQFILPAGATSLTLQQGSGLVADGTLVFSTLGVPPGVTDINFTYFLPFEGSEVTLSRKTDYPIADFQLLVQDNGVKVTSGTLAPGTSRDLNGTRFIGFGASNVQRGAALDASFSGIPESSTPSGTISLWPWLLGGLGLLGVVVAFAYPRMSGRREVPVPVDVPAGDHNGEGPQREDALLFELARLDEEFEAGILEETKYRRQRTRVKASLVEIYSAEAP